MSAPLIGLTTRRWPVSLLSGMPPAYADALFDVGLSEYSTAVADAGGVPVHLARDPAPDDVLQHLGGLVLTGGADVDPALYGSPSAPGVGPIEPERDRWEATLVTGALERGIPVLGICRGMQLLNVVSGGTLIADLPQGGPDNHARFDRSRRLLAHRVTTQPGSLAAAVYGPTVEVNSLHHQAIRTVGHGLVVTGTSPDGTVEVLERPGSAVLGVQWHPEALSTDAGFRWFMNAARAHGWH